MSLANHLKKKKKLKQKSTKKTTPELKFVHFAATIVPMSPRWNSPDGDELAFTENGIEREF